MPKALYCRHRRCYTGRGRKKALDHQNLPGKVVLVAAGKSAWQMAKAAHDCLGNRIISGIVITKYDHVKMSITSALPCLTQMIVNLCKF